MSSARPLVEERAPVKHITRPRGSSLVAFIFYVVQPAIFGLVSTLKDSPMKAAYRKYPYSPPHTPTTPPRSATEPPLPVTEPPRQPPTDQEIHNVFIDALVQACHCRQHLHTVNTMATVGQLYHRARRRKIYSNGRQTRLLHRASTVQQPLLRAPLSREECLNMVDYYAEEYSTQATSQSPDPTPPLPPRSLYDPQSPGNTGPEPPPPLPRILPEPPDPVAEACKPDERSAADKLVSLLQDPDCSHDEAWTAYLTLPSPGVAYLTDAGRHLLMQRLATIRKKGKRHMIRYLSVVDDLRSLDIPLDRSEWNSAIALSAYCSDNITTEGVEAALHMWKQMEHVAHVKPSHVTFNILFDIAAKAGKFVLAEMILKEMETRGFSFNRFAHTSHIYYHGLKGDGGRVRKAYREFVEAGEIVDTVVMNCVMASLIRAGELPAAEQVYERMKDVLRQHTGRKLHQTDWKVPRNLGRILNRAAKQFKNDPAKIHRLREKQFLAPDAHTYTIFVEYHAKYSGELFRIAALLYEMQELGVPISGRIFVKIFKGFRDHGGVRYTAWTRSRLESVWDAMLSALDQGLNEGKPDKWMIVQAVRAFATCCNHERTLQIWEELRTRWKWQQGELEQIQSILGETVEKLIGKVGNAPKHMYR